MGIIEEETQGIGYRLQGTGFRDEKSAGNKETKGKF
jgi:hypothetical protein